MKHEDQVVQGQQLLRYLDENTTTMADDVYANNVSDYVCAKQTAAEKEQFFRNGPINIGLSCRLPNPGDFMTNDLTGVPILLVPSTGKARKALEQKFRSADGDGQGRGFTPKASQLRGPRTNLDACSGQLWICGRKRQRRRQP
jgi:hypothetical protein